MSFLLLGNPYFSAGTGLIGVGAGMAALRGTDYRLHVSCSPCSPLVGGAVLANRVARRNLTLSMEIPSRDKSYQWMMQWMSKNKSMKSQSFRSAATPSDLLYRANSSTAWRHPIASTRTEKFTPRRTCCPTWANISSTIEAAS